MNVSARVLVVVATLLIGTPAVPAQEADQPSTDLLARGQGVLIERARVESAAQSQFQQLELERLRFEAEQTKKRHQVVEDKMKELVGARVLELEALQRRTTTEELIRAVTADVPEPTQEEIDTIWERNKDRIRDPRETVEPRIRQALVNQKSQEKLVEFVESLTEKFTVEYFLDPLRFEVEADGPSLGPQDAPVTIIEFSDFECPYCSRVSPVLKRLVDEFPGQVRLVFRQYPLTSIHRNAKTAAEASLCAHDQGRFWEMHDALFSDQKNLSMEAILGHAEALGLDVDVFGQCVASHGYDEQILRDVRDGTAAGVTGTPAFFVNGRPFTGAVDFEEVARVVREELGE